MSDVLNIGIFGRRNAGKSSLLNFVTGQNYAIVSDVPGTTTDIVRKRFEMPGTGAVNLIDSAGIDDEGVVGRMRVAKSRELVQQIDFAVMVYTANEFSAYERNMVSLFRKYEVPFLLLHNQSDIIPLDRLRADKLAKEYQVPLLEFSCVADGDEADSLKEEFFRQVSSCIEPFRARSILEGLVDEGDVIWLVCPVDSEAPQGRLILPQVMAIRDILDRKGIAIVMQPSELETAVISGKYPVPDLVVTDSQVFGKVSEIIHDDWPLTGFSVLLARSKGPFESYLEGLHHIESLKDGDRILVLESCTHHSSCEDIGRVKIPALLRKKTGCDLDFVFVSGLDTIGEDISAFSLVIQCGACMITRRQLVSRLKDIIDAGVPVTNYGMLLAWLNGIADRSIAPFFSKKLHDR